MDSRGKEEKMKKFSRLVSIIFVVLCVSGCDVGVDLEQLERAEASEQVFCKKAGYVSSAWGGGGMRSLAQFYCAEKSGRLVLFLEPKCSRHSLSSCD